VSGKNHETFRGSRRAPWIAPTIGRRRQSEHASPGCPALASLSGRWRIFPRHPCYSDMQCGRYANTILRFLRLHPNFAADRAEPFRHCAHGTPCPVPSTSPARAPEASVSSDRIGDWYQIGSRMWCRPDQLLRDTQGAWHLRPMCPIGRNERTSCRARAQPNRSPPDYTAMS